MSGAEGQRFHTEAAQLREKGDTAGSLAKNVQALVAYAHVDNKAKVAEVLADGAIVKRNDAAKTGNRTLLISAKHDMLGSVEIARESGIPTAIALPLFELAKTHEALEELPDAVAAYREAVASPLPEDHDRPSVRANFKVHLATAEYKTGDKAALSRAEEALHELEGTDENRYEKDVWVSGGYMRMADILRTDDPAKATQALQKAKDIIDANPDLEVRKGQWEQLSATFTNQ